MTAERRDGGGTPFGDWVRNNKRLDSREVGLSVTDIDFVFHRFMTPIDRNGTREVQLLLDVEVKTFGAPITDSQRETLFFRHQQLNDKREHLRTIRGKVVGVWSFGVNLLRMAGAFPRNGELLEWGIFTRCGEIEWRALDWVQDLEEILCFERRPDNPSLRLTLRRHHKTRKLIMAELAPLGFEVETIVTRRS